MIEYLKAFVVAAAPTLKAAFIHAAKVAAYIVLSAALTAVYAYFEKKPLDPAVFLIVNTALAAARKAIESLNEATAAAVPYDPGMGK